MNDKILPNCVGRLDDVVEAIRDNNRIKAVQLLEAEVERRVAKERELRNQLEAELAKRYAVQNVLAIADCDFDECEGQWIELRKACGWTGDKIMGVDPAQGDDMTVETVIRKPTLRAEDLPFGTVMVLGGMEYELENRCDATGVLSFGFASGVYYFAPSEIQELIDRGVKFVLPAEGGAE